MGGIETNPLFLHGQIGTVRDCDLDEIHDRLNALEQDIPDLGNITLDLVVLAEKLLSWMLSMHVAMERVVLGGYAVPRTCK